MGLEEEIEEQKKKRAAAKGMFTRKTNAFTTAHGDEAPIAVLDGIYSEVELAFKCIEIINETVIRFLYEAVEEGTLIDEANGYISQLETQKVKLKIELEKARNRQNRVVQTSVSPHASKILVKKLDHPLFLW